MNSREALAHSILFAVRLTIGDFVCRLTMDTCIMLLSIMHVHTTRSIFGHARAYGTQHLHCMNV